MFIILWTYLGPGNDLTANNCPWKCEIPSNADLAVAYTRDLALRTSSIELMILSIIQFRDNPLMVCIVICLYVLIPKIYQLSL